MLPGKKYKPEDILQIAFKRIWFILVPFAIVAAATTQVARQLPDRYRSNALIQVMPQRVSESIVKSAPSGRIEDRLPAIQQQIFTRTRLERVIQDFNLYAAERRSGIMEDIVQKMRDDIKVDVIKGDAFRVSYIGSNARTVMQVTERLASLFIDENLRDREVLARDTEQFLAAELEEARGRLIEQEKKLEVYRGQHAGELPSQLDSNLQVIQNVQVQIQSVVESLHRDRDRRTIVDRQIADLRADAEATLAPLSVQTSSDPAVSSGTTAQQLAQARATLQSLELRFKSGHPDLGIWQRRIRDLEQRAEAEALAAPVSPSSPPAPATPQEAIRQRRLADLQVEREQLDRQIAFKQGEENRLRAAVATYQARVERAPGRESEMAELTRDYATMQTLYTNLLTKKEDANLLGNLERRQIGEQFRLLDPARIPEKPFSPNRQSINIMGLVGGLAVGLVLVGFFEYRDSSFKTDDEVTALLGLPVLAVVPSMRSEPERRALARKRLVIGVGMGSTVTACLAVVLYTFLR